jgi:hypothetical protein
MSDQELDETYTALCQALEDVGEDKTSLFLATLGLALLARQPSAAGALPLIAQAQQLASM